MGGVLAMPMMHEFAHSQDEAEIYKHAAAKLSISLILVLHNHHLFFEAAELRNPLSILTSGKILTRTLSLVTSF